MPETQHTSVQKQKVTTWSALKDRTPAYTLVANVDLVVIRYDDHVSVFYGRCLHRGALMADGSVDGHNLIGVHPFDIRNRLSYTLLALQGEHHEIYRSTILSSLSHR